MTARLFGGWDFTADDAAATDLPAVGYPKGVPMTHQERAWTSSIWYTPERVMQ